MTGVPVKISYKFWLLITLCSCPYAHGQEQDEKKMEVPGPPPKQTTRDNRKLQDLTVTVIPVSLGWVLPTKNGVAVTWIYDASWSIELEYLRASYGLGFWGVDMANLSEQHSSIHALYYPGNSFYWKAGLGRRDYEARFGLDYLRRITGNTQFTPAEAHIRNEVLTLGLGNRWQFDNGVTWGIEWLDLLIALGAGEQNENFMQRVEDEEERRDLQDIFDFFRQGTTFQTMKLSLGYTF